MTRITKTGSNVVLMLKCLTATKSSTIDAFETYANPYPQLRYYDRYRRCELPNRLAKRPFELMRIGVASFLFRAWPIIKLPSSFMPTIMTQKTNPQARLRWTMIKRWAGKKISRDTVGILFHSPSLSQTTQKIKEMRDHKNDAIKRLALSLCVSHMITSRNHCISPLIPGCNSNYLSPRFMTLHFNHTCQPSTSF